MSDRLKALREQRGLIVTEMKKLVDDAEKAKRDLSAEEIAKHGELHDKQEGLRAQIQVIERQQDAERETAAAAAEHQERTSGVNPEVRAGTPEHRALVFNTVVRGGLEALSPEARTNYDLAMQGMRSFLTGSRLTAEEARALQVTPDTAGGYLLTPTEFVATLIRAMNNLVFVRPRATKYPSMNANGIGAPTLDTDFADLDWTNELLTGNEDTTMAFGKRELKPHPLAKLIKVSKQLMRTAAMPIDEILQERIAYKIAVTQEKAYLTGTGANQPLGLFTAGSSTLGGITTARDFKTGNSTTSIGADGLIEAKMQTKTQYWRTGEWIFHRDAMRQIAKLKDGEGQYLWRPGLTANEPDTLLSRPLNISEYAPNTFTTGLYVGIYGDLSYYWITDLLDLQIQRLVELYAATNQDGFIVRYEGDGMPVLEEAFARVTLA